MESELQILQAHTEVMVARELWAWRGRKDRAVARAPLEVMRGLNKEEQETVRRTAHLVKIVLQGGDPVAALQPPGPCPCLEKFLVTKHLDTAVIAAREALRQLENAQQRVQKEYAREWRREKEGGKRKKEKQE